MHLNRHDHVCGALDAGLFAAGRFQYFRYHFRPEAHIEHWPAENEDSGNATCITFVQSFQWSTEYLDSSLRPLQGWRLAVGGRLDLTLYSYSHLYLASGVPR